MQSHHRIYTGESLQHGDITVVLNSAHAIVDHTLVVCYHAHCSIANVGCLLIMGGIVIYCDSEVLKC